MMIWAAVLALISIIAVVFYWRTRERNSPHRKPGPPSAKSPQKIMHFHAVTIVCGEPACDVARACVGIKYLSKDAPRLPLAGCNRQTCDCRYEHYEDRREQDRRELFANRNNPLAGEDKRSSDRRGSGL